MTDIVVTTSLNGTPVNGLATAPNITIWTVAGAVAQASAAMTDSGVGGKYTYNFTPTAGVHYMFEVDADPLAAGQVDVRYFEGTFDNEQNDIWNDRGLNPTVVKTITEVTLGADYDEAVAAPTAIAKDVTKVGAVTTIDRA